MNTTSKKEYLNRYTATPTDAQIRSVRTLYLRLREVRLSMRKFVTSARYVDLVSQERAIVGQLMARGVAL